MHKPPQVMERREATKEHQKQTTQEHTWNT